MKAMLYNISIFKHHLGFDITLTDNGSHAAMIGIELAEKRSKIDQILNRTKK